MAAEQKRFVPFTARMPNPREEQLASGRFQSGKIVIDMQPGAEGIAYGLTPKNKKKWNEAFGKANSCEKYGIALEAFGAGKATKKIYSYLKDEVHMATMPANRSAHIPQDDVFPFPSEFAFPLLKMLVSAFADAVEERKAGFEMYEFMGKECPALLSLTFASPGPTVGGMKQLHELMESFGKAINMEKSRKTRDEIISSVCRLLVTAYGMAGYFKYGKPDHWDGNAKPWTEQKRIELAEQHLRQFLDVAGPNMKDGLYAELMLQLRHKFFSRRLEAVKLPSKPYDCETSGVCQRLIEVSHQEAVRTGKAGPETAEEMKHNW